MCQFAQRLRIASIQGLQGGSSDSDFEDIQVQLLGEWVAAGKAIAVGVDKYQLTMTALSSYRVCLSLTRPKPALTSQLDDDLDLSTPLALESLENRTTLELWVLLRRHGWQEVSGDPMSSKKLQALNAYRKGDQKDSGLRTGLTGLGKDL